MVSWMLETQKPARQLRQRLPRHQSCDHFAELPGNPEREYSCRPERSPAEERADFWTNEVSQRTSGGIFCFHYSII